jgi:hypothetical protein
MATTLTFLLLNVLVIAPLGFRIMVGLNRRLSHLQAGVRYTTIASVILVLSIIRGFAITLASYKLFGRPPFCGMGFPHSPDCPNNF